LTCRNFWGSRKPRTFLAVALIALSCTGCQSGQSAARTIDEQPAPSSRIPEDFLIVPGVRAGALSLGDAETKIFELFPKPSIGQSPGPPGCGKDYLVGLLEDASHPGFLRVFAIDGRVVEIEASRARYHTSEGIAGNSSPEEVRLHYPGLESYLYLGGSYEALNLGPLVVWTDQKKGIAFSFAYRSLSDSSFVVSSMIVFKGGASSFCEEESVFPSPKSWRKLAPYSLGGSKEAAFSIPAGMR
jgi:hypothetical protein